MGVLINGLAEQAEQRVRLLVGDRQRLDVQLLANLQGLQGGALRSHVGVDQGAKALLGRIDEVVDEALLQRDRTGLGSNLRRERVDQQLQRSQEGHGRK